MTYKKLPAYLVLFAVFACVSLIVPKQAEAKKVLPRFQSPAASTKTKTTTTVSKTKPNVSVKFRTDRRAIVVTFSNLSVAQSLSYTLVYTANGVQQGFGGGITQLSGTQTREIVLGTCSHGTCRYDTGIKNATFSVKYQLLTGKTHIKNFRLKV